MLTKLVRCVLLFVRVRQKLRCCRSMVHSVRVNKSKSSSEKSTGLSRELCRPGDRHASPDRNAKSGSGTAEEEEEEAVEEALSVGMRGAVEAVVDEVVSPGSRAGLLLLSAGCSLGGGGCG